VSAFVVGLCLSAGPANAACAPDPASSGQTVTCSGNTPAGFQAGGGVNNLTVNVLPGATASDGGGGVIIGVNDFNTVTNSGTLTAGPNSTGIFAGVNNTIVNAASGVITVGDDGKGIFAAGNSTITNYSTSEQTLAGKVGFTQINLGTGFEYQLENYHNQFIHLFAEVDYGTFISSNTSSESFSGTKLMQATTISVGINFGIIK